MIKQQGMGGYLVVIGVFTGIMESLKWEKTFKITKSKSSFQNHPHVYL